MRLRVREGNCTYIVFYWMKLDSRCQTTSVEPPI